MIAGVFSHQTNVKPIRWAAPMCFFPQRQSAIARNLHGLLKGGQIGMRTRGYPHDSGNLHITSI